MSSSSSGENLAKAKLPAKKASKARVMDTRLITPID
jgi:hypothetical protein